MAPTRPLMRGIRPPRVFSTRTGGRASPYSLALAALLAASACLLALIAFGVFSLPVSSPTNLATTADTESGSTGESDSSSHPARNRARRDLSEGLGERGAQWTEVVSWEPRAFVYHNFLMKDLDLNVPADGNLDLNVPVDGLDNDMEPPFCTQPAFGETIEESPDPADGHHVDLDDEGSGRGPQHNAPPMHPRTHSIPTTVPTTTTTQPGLAEVGGGANEEVASSPSQPFLGMRFDTIAGARAHYNAYALKLGFSIKSNTSKRATRTNELEKQMLSNPW